MKKILGPWVASLRVKLRSNKLTDDQVATAEDIGVRFSPPYRGPKPKPPSRAKRKEGEYVERLKRLDDFYSQHGHINVPQLVDTEELPGCRAMGCPYYVTVSTRDAPPGGHQDR